jgi:hypothetical protein
MVSTCRQPKRVIPADQCCPWAGFCKPCPVKTYVDRESGTVFVQCCIGSFPHPARSALGRLFLSPIYLLRLWVSRAVAAGSHGFANGFRSVHTLASEKLPIRNCLFRMLLEDGRKCFRKPKLTARLASCKCITFLSTKGNLPL